MDGRNLSVTNSAAVDRETAIIRQRHGAFRSAPLRRALILGRYAERLIAGCYKTRTISYSFALDETPSYRQFTNVRAGSRFTYEYVMKLMQKSAGPQSP